MFGRAQNKKRTFVEVFFCFFSPVFSFKPFGLTNDLKRILQEVSFSRLALTNNSTSTLEGFRPTRTTLKEDFQKEKVACSAVRENCLGVCLLLLLDLIIIFSTSVPQHLTSNQSLECKVKDWHSYHQNREHSGGIDETFFRRFYLTWLSSGKRIAEIQKNNLLQTKARIARRFPTPKVNL